MHKYDPRYLATYRRNFGPDPIGDIDIIKSEIDLDPSTWRYTKADEQFLKVIKEMHKRGMKVILDYSWNHTGHKFWAWNDIIKNQELSIYKDWYWVKTFDNPETDSNEFDYQGWFGVKDLPEIRETNYLEHHEKLIPDTTGNLFSEDVKKHIFNVAKRWLDPNQDGDPSDGVDGYRLDVAAELPFGFWREFRKVVRDINPDAYLLGEVWWEQWPDKLMDPAPFLKGDIFDSPMNYRWYSPARKFFAGDPEKLTVSDFIDSLQLIQVGIRKANKYAMMNLNGSHDSPRVLTSLFNKNMYKVYAKPEQDSTYKIYKPDIETFETLKLLLAHQFTYIGAPHIWAGDEMGMWGADDPSCRKPLIWPDYEFESESTHPLDLDRPTDQIMFNKELFAFYQKLISIRKNNSCLIKGDIEFTHIDNENGILGYKRYSENSEVITILNTSNEDQLINLNLGGDYQNLLDDNLVKLKKPIIIPARSPLILRSSRR